jgi:two-component system OmpR family sensor kinase
VTAVRRWGASRLVLRIYLVMVLAIACVVAVIVFGRSRREPPPFPNRTTSYLIETLARERQDPGALRAELQRLRAETGLTVTIYGEGGQLRGSSAGSPPPPAARAELAALEGSNGSAGGPTPRGTREGILLLSPGGAHALLESDRRPQGPDFRVDIALVLLSLGIASLVLGRMIARPLSRIAAAARGFGAGDLTVRAGLRRADELGQLSLTFDEMADRLTHLLRAQRELLASVSHELRTPLSRIRVALDLAAEGDSEEARQSLRDIAGDLGELEELVNDILAMARLETAGTHGIPRLRTQPVDARALAERAAARFTSAHPQRPLELALADGLTVDADPNLLRRVLENLLENAHKYSPGPTPIRLGLTPGEGGAVFTVADRGQGISAADLPYVFEPFFRADRSRTRGTGGVGLGLALSRRVVEAHGGHIAIDSELDRGTTVTFSVPLLPTSGGNTS